MQKINETVLKSQCIFRSSEAEALHQPPVEQNWEGEDSKLIQMLKSKVQKMKLPLHELQLRDKLSTVMEESQNQSPLTLCSMRSPREYDPDPRHGEFNDEPLFERYAKAEAKPEE
jgi:hypothetical protein